MAVKIRMMRIGRRHRPFFRINAVESRNQRNGRILEKLGHYDPIEKDQAKQIVLNLERIKHWLDVGAVPTDAVSQILLRHGIKTKHYEAIVQRRQKAKAIARAAGKPFTKAERLAADKPEIAETAEAPKAVEAEEAKAEAPKAIEAEEVKAEAPKTGETADAEEIKAETPEAAEPEEVKAEADETTEAPKAAEAEEVKVEAPKAAEVEEAKTEAPNAE